MKSLKIGVAEADITPSGHEDLCGYARREGTTNGHHDRLHTRALWLSDGYTKAIVSANDLISLSRHSYESLSERVKLEIGTDTAVNIACTHTHSGPATVKLKACGKASATYMRETKESIVAAMMHSLQKTKNVVVSVSRTTVDFSCNRRKKNGIVDPELVLICFADAKTRKPVAFICNYSCHAVVLGPGNLKVSADYPGYLQTRIREKTGAPCLFLNGACGNVNPKVVDTVEPSAAREMGCALADAALDSMKNALWLEDCTMTHGHVGLHLPVAIPRSGKQIEMRTREISDAFGLSSSLFSDSVESMKRKLANGTYPRQVAARLTALTFGQEIAVLFMPGELFAEIGLRIKDSSPFPHTIISAFSNGTLGYLPTREAYKEGGYEPYMSSFFYDGPQLDPGIEDVIVSRATQVLTALAEP